MELIAIAHPAFRSGLIEEAKKLNLIYSDQAFVPGKRGEYPEHLEAHRTTKSGLEVLLRPVKISDESLLKDFFYSLSDNSLYQRFISMRKDMSHERLHEFVVIDYTKQMVILAVIPEAGKEKVVGVGQCGINETTHTAEVGFLVRDDHQGRGIGSELLSYLTYLAKRQGLLGFFAEVLVDLRELDVLLATGEQMTVALFSMAIKDLGEQAVSMTGYHAGIITSNTYGSARINWVETLPIMEKLHEGRIVAVAGFQGYDDEGNITTLGRGGSDTTAVELAAALGAEVCEIYTDVEGVFTADPNIYAKARKLDKISYEEMLEMASMGAKVLHLRAVEFGMKYHVPILVLSSFTNASGTLVTKEDEEMENVVVSGITYNRSEARITVTNVPDVPGMAAQLFRPISKANVNVDLIVQGSGSFVAGRPRGLFDMQDVLGLK